MTGLIRVSFKNVHAKLVIFAVFMLVLLQGGCEPPFGPTIPSPEFASRKIKNIDVWFIMMDKGDLMNIPLCYNNEVSSGVVDGLTRKGYSVKHYSYAQDPGWRGAVLSGFFPLIRKQYPNGQPPSDIDAVFYVEADVYYRSEFGTKDSQDTPYGYYYRGVAGTPTGDLGNLDLSYIVFEPSLKRHILGGTQIYPGGTSSPRHYEILSRTPMGYGRSLNRWRFVESQEDYIRRRVDDAFTNLPSCQ
ncbi:MAG: hypothetical protein ABSB91_06030 [Sedimentisphaerales bacterium]